MKLSVSAYRAHASAHKKILSSSYQSTLNYGSTAAAGTAPTTLFSIDPNESQLPITTIATGSGNQYSHQQHHNHHHHHHHHHHSHHQHQQPNSASSSSTLGTQQLGPVTTDLSLSPGDTRTGSMATSKEDDEDSSNAASSDCKSPGQRTKSNQRWMKLRTTVQLSSAIQKKPVLKREDSFLKRFSTRQIPETQETMEETGSESASGDHDKTLKRRRRYLQKRRTVVNPDENFYFHWLMVLTACVLYNLWTLIVRQSFPELQAKIPNFWFSCDCLSDIIFVLDIAVQLRTGYLEQGLMVYDDKKLATHYMRSKNFLLDLAALIPLDLLQLRLGTQPLLRFPRFFKVYRSVKFYYIVESRTVWPNLWRVVNLIHILLILAHWFGCFYFLLSEAEGFQGDWVYPYRPGDYATLTRKYLGSLYWSTLTLTTIGDLPTPETNAEPSTSADGPRSLPRRGLKSRLLQFASNYGYIFTIVSYLIGVFIFATIVGQVGNVITNRNANRLEFERLLDGAKTYMRHHKVPGGMKRRVLRWYDYSWSRGRIQGGGDINTALGLLPDKLKTELALHVNLSVLKKVTIFQECQPEFLHDLVLKMKAYIFTPGDSICRKGEVAREMFIIADGILEVLSETGKVLTTMKAGDFFGEIGILNLDGLNKRTADVRSVGYSELFSLSREDVLAAMKDYPEAQEILQTLGRKRLMEVRCVNKKHAKHLADKESIASNVPHANVDNNSEISTSKRIVDKLRSDVKGIKNVLRKSRWTTGRRSNESIELQPLQGTVKTPKGVLRRMPRVRSDENAADNDGINSSNNNNNTTNEIIMLATTELISKDKSPSPIGAGLPLLQRLRLLKEKQDREERAVKPALPQPSSQPPMISPTSQTHLSCAVSPQQSIQEEPEREVLGAGLPLMQRLKLLKAKEERLARECRSKISTQIQSGAQSSSSSPSFIINTAPGMKLPSPSPSATSTATAGTITATMTGPSPSPSSSSSAAAVAAAATTSTTASIIPSQLTTIAKPALKVSFQARIKALQQLDNKKSTTIENSTGISSTASPILIDIKDQQQRSRSGSNYSSTGGFDSSEKLISSGSGNNKTSKPSATHSIKDKIKQFSHHYGGGHKSSSNAVSTGGGGGGSSSGGKTSMGSIGDGQALKPWSKLKLATVVSTGGSYTSLTSSMIDDSSPTDLEAIAAMHAAAAAAASLSHQKQQPQQQQTSTKDQNLSKTTTTFITNKQQTIQIQNVAMSCSSNNLNERKITQSDLAAASTTTTTTTTSATTINEQRSIVAAVLTEPPSPIPPSAPSLPPLPAVPVPSTTTKLKLKPKPFKLPSEQKLYNSVDDLSPEYSGLPFVKKLKILNERQKLAELESAIQTRSFSLDCTESQQFMSGGGGGTSIGGIGNNNGSAGGNGPNGSDLMDSLIRSHSEASGIARPKNHQQHQKQPYFLYQHHHQQQQNSLNVSSQQQQPFAAVSPTIYPQCLNSPLSPESNETFERRQLKSILKKLSEEKNASVTAATSAATTASTATTMGTSRNLIIGSSSGSSTQDLKGLLRAPTVEGYVARHSKFMKSVTFNSTLSSPPNSANSAIETNNIGIDLNHSGQSQQDEQPKQHFFAYDQLHSVSSASINSMTTQLSAISATTAAIPICGGGGGGDGGNVNDDDNNNNNNMQENNRIQNIGRMEMVNDEKQQRIQCFDDANKEPNYISSDEHLKPSPPFITKKFIKGSIEDHEYFGEVLLGIKHVIQNHLREVQVKFQDRFLNLEMDVRQRDDVISQLRNRIYELERNSPQSQHRTTTIPSSHQQHHHVQRGSSTGTATSTASSSGDIPFMRGDSVDTVFVSSPPPPPPPILSSRLNRDRSRPIKYKSKMKRRRPEELPPPPASSSTSSFIRIDENKLQQKPQWYNNRGSSGGGGGGGSGVGAEMLIEDSIGNLSQSVVLNIGNSSNSSSSSSESHINDDDDEDNASQRHRRLYSAADDEDDEDDDDLVANDDDDDDEDDNDDDDDDDDDNGDLHCDDWEIRMLAAELNRRESKQTELLKKIPKPDDASGGSIDDVGRLLRRRRRTTEVIESPPDDSDNIDNDDDDDDDDDNIDDDDDDGGVLLSGGYGSSGSSRRGEGITIESTITTASGSGDILNRPRAASFDQHNLGRQKIKGVFKAMSFDRDKDRL